MRPAREPEKILHDVGAVGADHDELAVRHVDDAHQAIRDGEPERGEEQDRAERHAGEDEPRLLTPAEPAFDFAQAFASFDAKILVLLAFEHRDEERARVRIARPAERVDRGEPRGPVPGFELERGADLFSSARIAGSLSLSSAFFTSGSIDSSALPASSFAAASRVAASGDASFVAASAACTAPRSRLFTTTSSRSAGAGSSFAPVTASTALRPP